MANYEAIHQIQSSLCCDSPRRYMTSTALVKGPGPQSPLNKTSGLDRQSAKRTASEHISNVSSPRVTREDRTVTDFMRSGKRNNQMQGRLLDWILDRR